MYRKRISGGSRRALKSKGSKASRQRINRSRRAKSREIVKIKRATDPYDLNRIDTQYSIIGSGGYGLVLRHKNRNLVIKLYYGMENCNDAKKEFAINQNVYDVVNPLKETYRIKTTRPVGFTSEPIVVNGQLFSCVYVMEYLNPIYGNELHQLIMNEAYLGKWNRPVGRVYTLPVSEVNPSRGIFADSKFMNKLYQNRMIEFSVEEIVFRMGLLFGLCVFGAHYIPMDAEYVISVENGRDYITLLDFGLFETIKPFSPNNSYNAKTPEEYAKKIGEDLVDRLYEIDLYFPHNNLRIKFAQGFRQACDYYPTEFNKTVCNKFVELI